MDRKIFLTIFAVSVFIFVYIADRYWSQRSFVTFTLSSLAPLTSDKEFHSNRSVNEFPASFLIGTSSSAYQIEGGWNEGGKSASIWDDFVHSVPNAVDDNTTADVGPDSFHHYQEDISALKLVGVIQYLVVIIEHDALLISMLFV